MMNEHALRVLEFDKLREIIAGFAVSEPGRALITDLTPARDEATVAERLAETQEFLQVLQAGEHPSFDGIRDIRQTIDKLSVTGMMLQPRELLDVAVTLAAGRRLMSFIQRLGGTAARRERFVIPRLSKQAARIAPLKHQEDAVFAVLDESGEVKDSASPELRRIRKQIARLRDEVLDRMSRILRDTGVQEIVQDQVITVRDDRYVIPLKPNFRQSLKGVVHGHSGSRATLFVEPLEVLEQNNRLAELHMEERDEVDRILRRLTALLVQDAPLIAETLDALARLDAICARARYGLDANAVVPALSRDGRIILRQARHPLLVWKQRAPAGARPVVPNEIALTRHQKVLIISGPNAGGKTVVLKTVGLLCLMTQSGVPVTAAEGTELPVLSDVFADIGDEQSLEQDLSTFSSHASRLAEIIRGAGRSSLVLLDELGAGTDPAEGAALGSAVLAKLLDAGCTTVVTTHHSGLKLFGSRTEGAVNGAMEFDPDTLKPTYRFIPGRPGRSYGLDMAERLGVPDGVVRDARARLTGDEAGLDRLLEQVEEDARALRRDREQAGAERLAAQKLMTAAEELMRTATNEAADIRAKAKQEARGVLANLRQKFKELSRTAAGGAGSLRAERRAVEDLARRLEPDAADEGHMPYAALHSFGVGDRVTVPKLHRSGTVLFVHKDGIEIDAGGLKLRLPTRDVIPVEEASAASRTSPASGWSASLLEREGIPDRVNLLGMRVDEALAEVDRFVDRAALHGFRQITVIHGLGTGALKDAVTALLRGHALIASIRPGETAEGGAGVTVAELKADVS
jgi:DNA mismatch repair protein MutS2